MVSGSLINAREYYLKAKKAFDEGEFQSAKKYIDRFHSLNYEFVEKSRGSNFKSAKNAVCIVSHKKLPETMRLLDSISSLFRDSNYSLVLVSNAESSLFPYADDIAGGNVLQLIAGGNFGASIGRNIAVHFTAAETITFLDDDGFAAADAVRKLVATRASFDAVAVRGRVMPMHNFMDVPKHYDFGRTVKQRFADIEGMTTWQMAALKYQQFDPLLYGHEGVELTGRLYPLYGPDAFIYEPEAVLLHDFVKPDAEVGDKIERMKRNDEYIANTSPDLPSTKSVFYSLAGTTYGAKLLSVRRGMISGWPSPSGDERLTFVTTCYNGAAHLLEYCASIKRQTNGNFEVVFVDDGSSDDSAAIAAREFESDRRFRLIQADHLGRSGALNVALQNIGTKYAAIADVDDVCVPQRVEWTLRAYEQYPTADLIGFSIFDRKSAVRSARPFVSKITSIGVRRYFGMPSPFPGLSFRRDAFTLPFDTRLDAGVDCDWLHRNMATNKLEGWYVPIGVTFYRTHDGQITASKRELQKKTSISCVRKLHEELLGPFLPDDEDGLELFTGWKPIASGSDWHRVKDYADRLVHALEQSDVSEKELIQDEIIRHVDERLLNLAKSDQSKFKTRMERAEQKLRSLGAIEEKLTVARSKLEWNRNRVKELEKKLADLSEPRPRKWFGRLQSS